MAAQVRVRQRESKAKVQTDLLKEDLEVLRVL